MVEKLIPALSVNGVFPDSFVMGSLDIGDAYLQVPQSNRRRVKILDYPMDTNLLICRCLPGQRDGSRRWCRFLGASDVCSQQTLHPAHESWTGTMDGARLPLTYILANGHVTLQQVWHDYIPPIGLDHRCVNCSLQWSGTRLPPKHKGLNLQNWVSTLDEDRLLMEQLTRMQETFSKFSKK